VECNQPNQVDGVDLCRTGRRASVFVLKLPGNTVLLLLLRLRLYAPWQFVCMSVTAIVSNVLQDE
jgi:hypothetical protein